MAANTIPSPCPKSNLTRRAALHGAAAVGVLALPAAVAVAAIELPGGTDPHLGWWRERAELLPRIEAAFDQPEEDDLFALKWEIEDRIAQTVPTTLEGAALVATVLLLWAGEVEYRG